MKNYKFVKVLISLGLLFSIMFSFSTNNANASTPQIGTVDVTKGDLKVRNAASEKANIVGSLKRSAKIKVYNKTKNGWLEIRYKNKKAYVSAKHVRFYKTTSLKSAKVAFDRILSIQNKTLTSVKTKQQLHKSLSPVFTTDYINNLMKYDMKIYGKDKKGNALYGVKDSDYVYYLLLDFDWALEYYKEKPIITFYIKNGVEYLEIAQYEDEDTPSDSQWTRVYLKKEAKSNWKVYNVKYYE